MQVLLQKPEGQGKVITDGFLGKSKLLRDFTAGQPFFTAQPEDLLLLNRQLSDRLGKLKPDFF